ncbi:MAG: FAD-dependent oxidoreductase [Longimicrobiales bacterium]
MADVTAIHAADVLIIGAGPAGIAAACIAAETGASVVVIDENPRPGGQIWRHISRHTLPGQAKYWLHRLDKSRARVHTGTSVVDITRGNAHFAIRTAGIVETVLLAKTVILATGARELFLPFPGWTLPGITGVGGGQALLKSGTPMAGKRVIIAGSGPLLLPVAAAFAAAGAHVSHILEQAPGHRVTRFALGLWRSPMRGVHAVIYRSKTMGSRYRTGTWVTAAEGQDRVRAAIITDGRRTWTERCDMLCVGYGLIPQLEIAQIAECDTAFGRVVADAQMSTTVAGIFAAGESSGVAGITSALVEGEIAARSALQHVRRSSLHEHATADAAESVATAAPNALSRRARREAAFAARMNEAFELRAELRQVPQPKTIVCRCEDVVLGDIARCESMREARLHTRAGMGPCQGRVCGPALELLFNWSALPARVPAVPAPVSTFLSNTSA